MKNEKEYANITSLFVLKTTRDRLKEIGKKGETYDSIINRILNRVERKVANVSNKA